MRTLLWLGCVALGVACNNSSTSAPTATPVPQAPESEAYDPCAGKACGDPCTLCAPDDPDCMETMEVKGCSPDGDCVSRTDDLCRKR